MSEYFRYDVTYVMNITDIDDKIIIRARHKYLVEKFESDHPIVTRDLVKELETYLQDFLLSKFKSVSIQGVPVPNGDDPKVTLNYETARKASTLLNSVQDGESSQSLIAGFVDILGSALDAIHGASIKDPVIFRNLAAYWEADFMEDMKALDVNPPDFLVRVSEVVPEIVQFVEKLVNDGFAYVSEGSVYFDSVAYVRDGSHCYPKLRPEAAQNAASFAEEGEGALGVRLGGKRNIADFALWKASKAGEPQWPSPWGPGRPGWHIECSVMADHIIPGPIDIHSGGIDLTFPHHDNEIAQSEAYNHCSQWVNYFLHAGHLHIEGHKMSKSLKNFISIKEALKRYSARQLRLMVLIHSWNSGVYYKESTMAEVAAVETLFVNFVANVDALTRLHSENNVFGSDEREILKKIQVVQSKVHAALCDSFDTPKVLDLLAQMVNFMNVYVKEHSTPNPSVLKVASNYVLRILGIFGVKIQSSGNDSKSTNLIPILEQVSEFRDAVRKEAKQISASTLLKLCDQIRNKLLTDHGISFEDQGPNQPSLVKLGVSRPLANSNSDSSKLKEDRLRKQQEKEAKAAIPLQELFKSSECLEKYSKWDEDGIPTHSKDGEEVSKSLRKKLVKEYEQHKELQEKLNK